MERSDLGQLLLVGVPGTELDPETAGILRDVQPGGFILFGRNIKGAEQLRKLIDDLRDISRVEPIITIDQEGGRVSRLRLIGEEPPNAQQLREKGDPKLIGWHGELTGNLLRLFGFNLDLCPVLDISFDDDADNSLRGRCYGRSVPEVVRFAETFNTALQETGILTCGKHFPGYSCAKSDPHHDLPVMDRTRAELEAAELAVFHYFADRVDSMMVCHAWYPALDPDRGPASLSRRIVHDLLVGELAFRGLIMTDDLDMGAVINEVPFEEMIARALEAGNHVAMICHRLNLAPEAAAALGRLPAKLVDPALEFVARFKRRLTPPDDFSLERFEELNAQVSELRVATLGTERAAQRSQEDGKRSPVEVY